jgi:hypothetical protein
MNFRRGPLIEVIAVHGDIEAAARNRVSPNGGEQRAEAFGERQAAALDTDQHDSVAGLVAFGDFMGDARQGALDRGGVQMIADSGMKKSERAVWGRFAVVAVVVMASFATSRGRVKGAVQGKLLVRHLPGFAPLGAMLDDPVRQGPLEADVMPGFFRLDPLMPEDLVAFSLELAVKRGILQQIAGRKVFLFIRHTEIKNSLRAKVTPARLA